MANNGDSSPRNADFNEDEVMYVITRTGRKVPLDTNQITERLRNLINRKPKIPHVNPHALMLEVCKGLSNGISTYEIDEYAANASASLSVTNPYYLKVAARIAIDNHQKNKTERSFIDKMRRAYLNLDEDGKISPLLSSEFFKYVEENQDAIEKIIDYSRDFLLDFFGFRTFQMSYSIKINDKPIERPQDMFMRTAIALHMNEHGSIEEDFKYIAETYDLLSKKFYTHASPTYFNAGGRHPQYASCFLLGTEDSRDGIMHTADTMSMISKWAGGLGVHVSGWRGTNSRIRSTNGRSSGIVPFLQIYNYTLKAFNQGGRRPGRAAIYLMPHHPDIMKFIELGRNTGLDEQRARDLFYALWIPDIFMERVRDDKLWSLFDPDRCGDLSNFHGNEYRAKYLELEAAKKYTQQIPARDIWLAALTTNQEVGHPYICFSDTVNRLSMYSNIGTIKSSNLCSEIVLYSDHKEYSVCILSSLALPNFVFDGYSADELKLDENNRRELNHEYPVNPWFDYDLLRKVTATVVTNLNLIVDKTFHPVIETKRGNDRHRPIGVGVQGLDDCYAKMRMPFASDAAKDLNKRIFEHIYYAATSQSSKLARQRWMSLKRECSANTGVTVDQHHPDNYDVTTVTYSTASEIPKTIGAYPSMLWNGGSHISKGVFHWELAGLDASKLAAKEIDWESLRAHIKEFGVRNSVTIAVMPTASTSQLLGNNECIEPYTSNIYKRSTLAGEYIVIKKYLINDLYNLGIWSSSIKDYLLASEGSIQHIEGIPNDIKELYPTVWEIDQSVLVQQAIDRQPFVDQAQSLNLYVPDLSPAKWNKLMFLAWKGGLKTGKYYIHSKPAVRPQIFTLDPAKKKEMDALIEKNKHGTAFLEPLHEVCEVCSG